MSLPKVELRGGPHGKDVKLIVDGVEQKGVHRVAIEMNVQDAVRITTYQFASLDAAFDGAAVEDGGWQVELKKLVVEEVPVEGESPLFLRDVKIVGHGRGDSLLHAVRHLVDQMEDEANAR